MGFSKIGYQAFKLLGHRRLHEMASMWEERYPGVDIVLIEPEPTDSLMFETSIMSFSSRIEIARHGFQSVTYHLLDEYERYSEIWARHGIEISERRVRRVVRPFRGRGGAGRRLAQNPRRHHGRVATSIRLRLGPWAGAGPGSQGYEQRSQSLASISKATFRTKRRPCRSRSTGASRRPRRGLRCARDSARRARAARPRCPARARRAANSPPSSVGCASQRSWPGCR